MAGKGGRRPTTTFRKFYVEINNDEGGKKMKCTLKKIIEMPDDQAPIEEDCNWVTETNQNTNLRRHLKECHQAEYTAATEERPDKSAVKRQAAEQSSLTEYGFIPKKINVALSFSDVLISALKYITVDGRPFEVVNDAGFLHLVEPILRALPGPTKTVYHQKVRQLVQEVGRELRKFMGQFFKKYGNLVSLCLDGGAYHGRKFLGIKAQCRNLDRMSEFQSFTLGTVELIHSSTAIYLKKKVADQLKLFDIDLKNVISVTTDGGRNYLAVSKVINKKKKEIKKKVSGHDDGAESESEEEGDISQDKVEEALNELEDDWTLDDVYVVMNDEEEEALNEQFKLENILKLSMESIKESIGAVVGVRCIVHLVQLAVHDFLDSIDARAKKVIDKARIFVKKTRPLAVRNALKKEKCSYLSLDVSTRWNATYDMLQRLLDNRVKIMKCSHLVPECQLSDAFWKDLEKLVHALRPCFILTNQLSRNDLLPSDGYKMWMQARLELVTQDTNLSQLMNKKMLERQAEIFDQEFFNAILFLDPHFSQSLDSNQKECAIRYVIKMSEYVIPQDQNHCEPEPGTSDDPLLSFILIERKANANSLPTRNIKTTKSVQDEIESFVRDLSIPLPKEEAEDVLKFWERRKQHFPLLYRVCTLFFQIALSEVNVERLFSNLAFILNKLRTSLDGPILDDILLIRSNFDFIEKNMARFASIFNSL